MTTVQTKMTSKEMDDLATEITKTYLAEKTFGTSTEFIKLFLDVRDAARTIIEQRELAKQNSQSFNDLSDGAKTNSSLFR